MTVTILKLTYTNNNGVLILLYFPNVYSLTTYINNHINDMDKIEIFREEKESK